LSFSNSCARLILKEKVGDKPRQPESLPPFFFQGSLPLTGRVYQMDMKLATYHEEVKPLIIQRMGEIFTAIKGLDLGGKHLRGLLCLLVSDSLGGDRDRALTGAAVIDAIHSASLIHDDIVDEDLERRGHPSLWVTNGIKKAVATGDRVFAIAHKRAAMLGNKESITVAEAMDTTIAAWVKEAAPKPAELLVDLFTGQVPDVGYQKLCLTKTAPFFKAAARLGGIAAGANEYTLDTLACYAERTGLAFQYGDDYVDIIRLQQEKTLPAWQKLLPVIPAIFHYNGKNLRQALFEIPLGIFRDSLVGKGPGEKLLSLLSHLSVTEQLMADIKQEIASATRALEDISFQEDYQDMIKSYPLYAVNLMLAEVNQQLPLPEVEKEKVT